MFQLFLKLQESDQPWKNKFVIYFYMARKSHLFVFVCHKQWSSYYEKCIIYFTDCFGEKISCASPLQFQLF